MIKITLVVLIAIAGSCICQGPPPPPPPGGPPPPDGPPPPGGPRGHHGPPDPVKMCEGFKSKTPEQLEEMNNKIKEHEDCREKIFVSN